MRISLSGLKLGDGGTTQKPSTAKKTWRICDRRLLRWQGEYCKKWDLATLFPYEWSFNEEARFELRPGTFLTVKGGYSERLGFKMVERHGDVKRLAVEELLWEYERRTGDFSDRDVIHIEDPSPEMLAAIEEDIPERDWDCRIYFAVDISCPIRSTIAELESENPRGSAANSRKIWHLL